VENTLVHCSPPSSSHIYHIFDSILLLSHGRALYSGPGSIAPAQYFANSAQGVPPCPEGYNIADYLLEVASDPPVGLFQMQSRLANGKSNGSASGVMSEEEGRGSGSMDVEEKGNLVQRSKWSTPLVGVSGGMSYAATFLTQFEVLSGREWKGLRR
jgi:hypothetical protein